MIDAAAGTGKFHTEKVIAARLRGEGFTDLIVASTGITALQLPGGWTAHSMGGEERRKENGGIPFRDFAL